MQPNCRKLATPAKVIKSTKSKWQLKLANLDDAVTPKNYLMPSGYLGLGGANGRGSHITIPSRCADHVHTFALSVPSMLTVCVHKIISLVGFVQPPFPKDLAVSFISEGNLVGTVKTAGGTTADDGIRTIILPGEYLWETIMSNVQAATPPVAVWAYRVMEADHEYSETIPDQVQQ